MSELLLQPRTVKEVLPLLRKHPYFSETITGRLSRRARVDATDTALPRQTIGEFKPMLEAMAAQAHDPEFKKKLALGILPGATTPDSARLLWLTELCRDEPYTFIPPVEFDLPLSALRLIVPAAQRMASARQCQVATARGDILASLALAEIIDFKSTDFEQICQLALVPPTFEGLCSIADGDLLPAAIMLGLGIECEHRDSLEHLLAQPVETRSFEPQNFAVTGSLYLQHAPDPTPFLFDLVMHRKMPIAELPVKVLTAI